MKKILIFIFGVIFLIVLSAYLDMLYSDMSDIDEDDYQVQNNVDSSLFIDKVKKTTSVKPFIAKVVQDAKIAKKPKKPKKPFKHIRRRVINTVPIQKEIIVPPPVPVPVTKIVYITAPRKKAPVSKLSDRIKNNANISFKLNDEDVKPNDLSLFKKELYSNEEY
jgi:hypothetical protein